MRTYPLILPHVLISSLAITEEMRRSEEIRRTPGLLAPYAPPPDPLVIKPSPDVPDIPWVTATSYERSHPNQPWYEKQRKKRRRRR